MTALADPAGAARQFDVITDNDECWFVNGEGRKIVGVRFFSCHYPKTVSRTEFAKYRKKNKQRPPPIPQVFLAFDKVEPLGNHQWKVHFSTPQCRDEKGQRFGLKDGYMLVSAWPTGKIDCRFHVRAPAGGRFGWLGKPGSIRLIVATNVVFQKTTMASSFWKRPEKGVAYEARGSRLLIADCPGGRLFGTSRLLGKDIKPASPVIEFAWSPLDKEAAKAADDEYNADIADLLKPLDAIYERLVLANDPDPDETIINLGDTPELPEYPEKIVNHSVEFEGGVSFLLDTTGISPMVCVTEFNNQPLALSVSSSEKMHLFDADKAPPDFTVEALNACRGPISADMRVFVKDWDGNTVLEKSEKVHFDLAETKTWRFEIPSPTKRNFYFAEASFMAEDGRESFIRTHLATLPPYEHTRRDTSILGCQCDYPLPDWDSLRALMKRMGVHWIRGGGNMPKFWSQEDGMEVIWGYGAPMGIRPGSNRLEVAKEVLLKAREYGATIMEIGPNELNLRYLFGGNSRHDVENLLDWAKTFYEARHQLKLERAMRLATFGNGGSGGGVAERLFDNYGNEFLELLSLHPGRLNHTPDSTGADWAWHFTAQVNKFRWIAARKRPPDREIGVILTEVYARTPPFAKDSDSMRAAAENVLLSLILAKAMDIYALTFYKSHDGAYWDINGVDEGNKEYHYGLLLRDGVVKPSILGFCAAAEALDGAEFEKTATRTDKYTYRSWSFTSPKGRFTVAVDRTEGDHPYPWDDFPGFLDPWINHWKTTRDYVFAATTNSVRVIDAIGRERTITPEDGKVTIPLSGSPQIIYGIDPVPLLPAIEAEAKESPYASRKVAYADIVAYREGFYEVRRHLDDGSIETLASFLPIKGVATGALTPLRRNWALNPEGDEVVFRTVPGETPSAISIDGIPLKVEPAGDGLVKVRIGQTPVVLRGVGTSVSDGVVWTPREYPPYVNDHDDSRSDYYKGLDEEPDYRSREGRKFFDMGAPTVPDMLDDMID